MADWKLLSAHGLVLLLIADKPDATTREVARDLQFAERTVQLFVTCC